MAPQFVLKMQQAQPFVPFVIHVSDGTTYPIGDASEVICGPLYVCVGLDVDEISGLFRRSMYVAPNHITRLETVPPRAITSPDE